MYGQSSTESDFALLESICQHLLGETEGELPLEEDDSEDMMLYGVLRDAVNVGWVPFPSLAPVPT
ncbi:ethylene-responsive transcription factor 2 [Quercus suber]|uniref:Ethylene-responsive transcription factor 2 n=1 Tax=Quercus suber TaxID=58331 RepID=A0AAW0KUI9_QUESU